MSVRYKLKTSDTATQEAITIAAPTETQETVCRAAGACRTRSPTIIHSSEMMSAQRSTKPSTASGAPARVSEKKGANSRQAATSTKHTATSSESRNEIE